MSGFNAEILKIKADVNDSDYRQIREVVFGREKLKKFNYYHILLARIAKQKKEQEGNATFKKLDNFLWGSCIRKFHQIGIENLVEKHVILDTINKNVRIFDSTDDVGRFYSKIVSVDMKEVTEKHIRSFREFDSHRIFSQETACDLTGISKSLFLKWNSCLRIIPSSGKLSSVDLFFLKVLKLYIKEGVYSLQDFKNLDWLEFRSYLLANDFNSIDAYYFNFNKEIKQLNVFENYADSFRFNPSKSPTPFKYFLDEFFKSYEQIYLDRYQKSTIVKFPISNNTLISQR